MSEETIKRPEFNLFAKVLTDSIQSIESSMIKLAESTEKSIKLSEISIIESNHKFEKASDRADKQDERMTFYAKTTNEEIAKIYEDVNDLKEALAATESVSQFWTTVGKYARYSIFGALSALGVYYMNDALNNKKTTPQKPKIEVIQ